MAAVSGEDGSLSFTNLTVNVKSWTLNHNMPILVTTDFTAAATGYGTKMASGTYYWTATAEVNWSATNTAALGDSATLTLTADTGDTYAGTAIIGNMVVNTPAEDLVTVTYTFEGTGQLTVTL